MSQSPIYFDIDNNKAIIIALKAGDENVLMQSIAIISGDCALFVPNMFMNRRRLRKSCKKQ